jgi:glycosyltransferase involved in cell wall biosynthesis
MLDSAQSTPRPPREATRLKRVLFVLQLDPGGKFGSIEEQVLTLARAFLERGSVFVPVYLRALDGESAAQYQREGLDAEALDLSGFRWGNLFRLGALIKRYQIDTVHWNFYHPFYNAYLWALAGLKPGVEHYFTDHISRTGGSSARTEPGGAKLRFKRLLASRYSKFLCVSEFVFHDVRGAVGPRAERIHHFVNTDRFRPDATVREAIRRQLGVRDEFVAIVVAHLIRDKGVDVAIEAVARQPEGVVLWVVGQGPERKSLQSLADEKGVGSRVRFLGPQRHVEPFLQAADCALCPSIWGEAAGLVNIEALACGLPVLASQIGGIPEFVKHGCTGLLYTAGDAGELADCIRALVRDPAVRERMSQAARDDAIASFSAESALEKNLALYAWPARPSPRSARTVERTPDTPAPNNG